MAKPKTNVITNPKVLITTGAAMVLLCVGLFLYLQITAPYAVTKDGTKVENPWVIKIGDQETFLVASEKQGKQIIEDLKYTYYKDPAVADSATLSPKVTIVEKALPRGEDLPIVTTREDAVGQIVAINKTDTPMVSVKTTQQMIEEKPLEFETKVKKSKTLFEGEKKIEKKGKTGKGTVISQLVMENGVIVSETVLDTIVEEKPVAALITKGVRPMTAGDSYQIATGGGTILGHASGREIADFALQFLGNPYAYGGTSLTNGADCSGFTMSVFAHFGISLPHSASGQRSCGKGIPLSQAKPGDLVGYSGHIALYIGNGKVIHASAPGVGIIISDVHYSTILTVRRIVE